MLTVLIRDAKSVVKGKINVAISNSKIEKRTIAWEKNDVQIPSSKNIHNKTNLFNI